MIIPDIIRGAAANHLRTPARVERIALRKIGGSYYIFAMRENRPPLSLGRYSDRESAEKQMENLRGIIDENKAK